MEWSRDLNCLAGPSHVGSSLHFRQHQWIKPDVVLSADYNSETYIYFLNS